MADRTSTIRFRVEGSDVVRSNIQSLDRDIARMQRTMQNQIRKITQMREGGLDTKQAEAEARATAERTARLMRASEIERQRMMESYAQQAAAEKQRQSQAEGKLQSRALADDEKLYVQQEMKRIKAVEERTKMEVKAAAESARQKAQIDASYHKFVETAEERKLRILAEDYRRQKQLHANNAQELSRIDAAYVRQRDALVAQQQAKGGAGAHGRWQPEAYKTPAFGSMSDRFTAMFSISSIAASVTGDKSGARELGVAASGYLLGSPLFATMNAAAVGVGTYFRIVREDSEKAKQALRGYTEMLSDTASKWSQLSRSMIQTTSLGGFLQQTMAAQRSGLIKTHEAIGAAAGDAESPVNATVIGVQSLMRGGYDRTDHARHIQYLEVEKSARWDIMRLAMQANESEYQIAIKNQEALNKLKMESLNLARLENGLFKNRATLIVDERTAREQMRQRQDEEIRKADLAVAMAEKNRDAARDVKFAAIGTADFEAADYKYHVAKTGVENATRDRNRLPAQHERERLQRLAEYAARERMLEVESQRQINDQKAKNQDAWTRAEKRGYEQSESLREAAFSRERLAAAAHGIEMVRLVENMHKAIRAEEQRRRGEMRDAALSVISPEAALREYTRQTEDFKASGASEKESDLFHRQMTTAEYMKQTEEARLQLQLKRKQITQEEYELQMMINANPLARSDSGVAENIRNAMRTLVGARKDLRDLELAEQARKMMDTVHSAGTIGGIGSRDLAVGGWKTLDDKAREAVRLLERILTQMQDGGAQTWSTN